MVHNAVHIPESSNMPGKLWANLGPHVSAPGATLADALKVWFSATLR